MSCENPISQRTKVNEDGSLDKTIIFEKAEAKLADQNAFGVNHKNGWAFKRTKPNDSLTVKSDKEKYRLQFYKHFANDSVMNDELDKDSDTLFRVHARFEKKFRWFYTYVRYSETIRPINRFKLVSPKDFFTSEDDAFIKRLPAEGKTISKADSVYLILLNEKIVDHFANMGIFNETYQALEEVIKQNLPEKKWLDTLMKNKEFIYKHIEKDKGVTDFIGKITDSLKIPLSKSKATIDFNERTKTLNARLDFMSFARDGKYLSEFEMPWTVVHSNADSVVGNRLYWRPVVNKFVYMDYEMFAESRRLNVWAVMASVVIIVLTILSLRRKTID
jgi:hypothetical protein